MQREFRSITTRPRRKPATFRVFRAMIAAGAGLALSACADVTGPRSVASVAVRVPPMVQAELSLLTDFTVDAEITNTGSAMVLYDRWCSWRIEQLVNGSWAPAYNPVCAPEGREIYQLWVGDRAVHRYPAHRSWRVGNGAQIMGTYRVVLTVFSGAPGTALTDLDATVVGSNSFTVR